VVFKIFANVTSIALNTEEISEICAMQVLIVAATQFEIAPFLARNPEADILITGVGVPTAVYHLLKRLHQIDYDLVIQAGIAGSFNEELALGQVVLVQQDRFADLGVNESNQFSSIFDMGFSNEAEFPFNKGWLVNHHELLDRSPLRKVKAITVNTVHDQPILNKMFSEKFNADIESMEGAALHYTCLMEIVPFIQLRSISNWVGERDKSKWKIKEAVEHLNNELEGMIRTLTNKITN